MKPGSASLQEYARGIAGGLLFSLPLLYTMEVWWVGFSVHAYQLILYVIATFILLIGYNYYAGVHESAGWKEIVIDSVEEIGIGFVLSLIVLWMLGRIDFSEMRTNEIMGKIIVESMTVAIGVSVGTAQLGGDEKRGQSEQRNISRRGHSLLALCGSILIAGNIAPTDEIQLIAVELSPIRLMAIAGFSLMLGTVIQFYSDFRGSFRGDTTRKSLQVISETTIDYIIALASCAFMLWFFGRFENVHFTTAINQVIVLGLPAIMGASAGKLLIKG